MSDVMSVDEDRTGLRIVESRNELCNCALAGTAGADEGDYLPRGDAKEISSSVRRIA